ncbi:LysR family transcriptional regulator [Chitinimonas sp.]|uniref:LysR family transcriptional regulator n=1 Tax=Chitinimonas sp. TaxID=1934313 RepID=UPI0035B3B2DE
MSISLTDLALLLDVADRGSFSQAAAARGWSQPQVSQRIALLESHLGTQLFQRHRRGAVATAACESYLESVRRALGELDAARHAIQGSPALPCVRVGCPPSLATLLFSPLIAALKDAQLELFCQVDHSPELMERVLSHRLQLAFVMNRPTINGVVLELLADSPIVAVVAASHPLANHAGALALRDLADLPVSPQWWGPDTETLVRLLRTQRRGALHINQPATTARELALQHGFVVFAPQISLLDDLQSGSLRQLAISDLPAWRWEVMMAYRAGKRPNDGRDQVLQAARQLGSHWQQRLAAA